MDYDLRALTENDKNLIYNWRNAEFIRVNMFQDELIPYEAHCHWFEIILTNQTAYYRIFRYNSKPLGLVSFKESNPQKKTCFWGFYIGEIQAPKGAGTWMGSLALDYAFQCLGMKTIIGEVLSFNKKSATYHRKLGFKHDLHYKNTLYRNGQPINIIRFVLDKEDWEHHKAKLDLNFT
ncbi:UDP-4-amino-4,6-dideoxy-N-acetyl-beta-L-altrosamine N-acetyltransferase [Shimazuella alba]|uniref:UDP-4-amino-4, 6-dideoxy-N-acetyl-beta-L-altrosamine N-acetyltransferase n=1 Tax=Shimazuella alba TaxID=2690964 RepID=A0A6I4VTA7_9BACL|nr:UDP-4-amino-4,6-dideoxy-N-acetyl-beta-L-altrosamine N-acetyltransferase [Shimazuella alba]MXQ54253.1 UDP-4-amino-4,6-dideoxy-N-acetyl-beta-L-altrosamine N-acetyltransferase [Shimazuella alba]